MSLSFPLLISAVPLYTIDWAAPGNQQAKQVWSRWAKRHPKLWAAMARAPDAPCPSHAPKDRLSAEKCWFSDGGIASNFPVHLFDSMLPRWPTFAINLKYNSSDRLPADRVELVETNGGGLAEDWQPLAGAGEAGNGRLSALFGAVLNTMQNWSDNAQARVPGYRDRIVHVHLDHAEGGLNLDMDQEHILKLVELGRRSGERLAERFCSTGPDGHEMSWDNHRWIRLRTTLALLDEHLQQLANAVDYAEAGDVSYAGLLGRGDGEQPCSYEVTKRYRREAGVALRWIRAFARRLDRSRGQTGFPHAFRDKNVPKPLAELRITPRL
jgi:hypothetical protein